MVPRFFWILASNKSLVLLLFVSELIALYTALTIIMAAHIAICWTCTPDGVLRLWNFFVMHFSWKITCHTPLYHVPLFVTIVSFYLIFVLLGVKRVLFSPVLCCIMIICNKSRPRLRLLCPPLDPPVFHWGSFVVFWNKRLLLLLLLSSCGQDVGNVQASSVPSPNSP